MVFAHLVSPSDDDSDADGCTIDTDTVPNQAANILAQRWGRRQVWVLGNRSTIKQLTSPDFVL